MLSNCGVGGDSWERPLDYSMPGFPVLHHLLEFAQTHVHWIGDANRLILCCPCLLLPSIFPSIRVCSKSWVFASGDQSIGASASVAVLPVNIQGWFSLGLTGLISLLSKGLSRVFSNTTVQKHQFFGVWLIASLNYAGPFAMTRQWSVVWTFKKY